MWVAEEIARFVNTDISQPADAVRIMRTAQENFGKLDIFVQNAGIYTWILIEDTDPAEWDMVMAVNLKGTFLAAQAALPLMRENGSGRMVFTSSITGPRVTSPGHGHYSATKAGINGFIKSAALDFSGFGITVNGVEPGNILTEGMQASRSPEFIRMMERPCRSAGWERRATLLTPSCSWPLTRRPISRAPPSSSTVARPCLRDMISRSSRRLPDNLARGANED
jgi:NAD(P)-dependent dehydrogenase (short-subunit alcohol dehydrogenase family)